MKNKGAERYIPVVIDLKEIGFVVKNIKIKIKPIIVKGIKSKFV